jgi:hypothetical protein
VPSVLPSSQTMIWVAHFVPRQEATARGRHHNLLYVGMITETSIGAPETVVMVGGNVLIVSFRPSPGQGGVLRMNAAQNKN